MSYALNQRTGCFQAIREGAKASAMFFSLIETAKANRLEPYSYLRYIFKYLPLAKTTTDYEKLLPQKIDQKKLIVFAL
ncbi:MAG: transposase domain-containing protein [Proteobacteria bacterium]|nr:transposase domain-containing protein [Pseudomonadota bacterium]